MANAGDVSTFEDPNLIPLKDIEYKYKEAIHQLA